MTLGEFKESPGQVGNATVLKHPQMARTAIGLSAAAAITVWCTYYPADATGLEHGRALGLTCAMMLWLLFAAMIIRVKPVVDVRCASWWLDSAALILAAWVFLAAWITAGLFSSSPPHVGGDLRAATNEAWWWIAAAGFFVVLRRLMSDAGRARAVFGLLLGLGSLLAVHTLHQYFISLPETMQEYLRDPDAAIASAGINAPAGSAARMIYENRLRDGGPTATFALANSVAGPLAMIATLCGGCLVCLLRAMPLSRESYDIAERKATVSCIIVRVTLLVALLCLLMAALIATGSRSGFMSVVVVGAVAAFSALWARGGHFVRIGLASLVGLAAVAVVVWWQAGSDSSIGRLASGARATIELRVQYWQSTLAMVWDHPWFGAGPGNFQLVYQRYRDVHAHEMIAEPHHFFVETLASGGVMAGILLTICLAAGWKVYRSTAALEEEDALPTSLASARNSSIKGESLILQGKSGFVAAAVALGALFGLLSVWYYGISNEALPDFEAHQYAIPAALVVMGAWWWTGTADAERLTHHQFRQMAAAATACGLTHLCFSGGWTIPGVSLMLVWLAAVATNVPASLACEAGLATETTSPMRPGAANWAAGLIVSVLFLVFVRFTLLPVQRTGAAMKNAAMQLNTNRVVQAEATLRGALQDDPLAKDAAIWFAGIENRKLMQSFLGPTKMSTRQKRITDGAFGTAISRAGNDPTLLRAIGELLLHRYQFGGRVDDLVSAEKLFSRAIELSPTQEAMVAQQSEIARELTSRGITPTGGSAAKLAARAKTLADSGGMVTRELDLQPILPARVIGRAALTAPVRETAAELLQRQPDGRKLQNRAE